MKQSYFDCRDKVIECLNLSKEMQLQHTQIEGTKLFQEVSLKIQIKFNNVFVFAKAFPLNDEKTALKNQVSHKQIQNDKQMMDDKLSIIKALTNSKKQLDLKFDVLTSAFLKKIQVHGSKVLHLTPYMFDVDNNYEQMIIEDEQFNQFKLSPNDLYEILKPSQGKLNIYLVLIELPNCQPFCNVFRELGVPHVISFINKLSRVGHIFHQDVTINNQFKIDLV